VSMGSNLLQGSKGRLLVGRRSDAALRHLAGNCFQVFLSIRLRTVAIALLMVRSVVEKRFLQEDACYASYLREVPWRWFPGIG